MRLIDTSWVLKIGWINEECFATPDILVELGVVEVANNQKIPENVKHINTIVGFDEGTYLKNYRDALRDYKEYYFFNMKGLGDVSIMAAVRTYLEMDQGTSGLMALPGFGKSVEVFTKDAGLINALKKKFGDSVKIAQDNDSEVH